MAPMKSIRDQAKKVLEAGDPQGAYNILEDMIEWLGSHEYYDHMERWALLDDQIPCLEALGDHEGVKRVRAEQVREAMEHDAKFAIGEIRAHHPVTDGKRDLPSRDRGPAPKPEDYRRD